MMAMYFLRVVLMLMILSTPSLCYAVFGTKRYNGRSSAIRRTNNNYSWGNLLQPYQQYARSQRLPINYYEMYPYNRDYQNDYYYPQDAVSYPVYFPPPRTSKYEVYQAVLPYYYEDRPISREDYNYYGYEKNVDPMEDLEEKMIQQSQTEEREEAQPIGQEVLYENDESDDNIDDVNDALKDLIKSQMSKEYLNKQKDYYDQYLNTDYYYDDDNYGRWDDSSFKPKQTYEEDKDVRELKQLAKLQQTKTYNTERGPSVEDRLNMFRKEGTKNAKNSQKQLKSKDNRYNWELKRNTLSANKKDEYSKHGSLLYGMNGLAFSDRKPVIKTTALPIISSTALPKITIYPPKKGGQKEEVLMRPATPVRNPFSGAILEMMGEEPERKREPSVYDTIKRMLEMENELENNYEANDIKPPMRKRIVTSEDSLAQQLSVLKKTQ